MESPQMRLSLKLILAIGIAAAAFAVARLNLGTRFAADPRLASTEIRWIINNRVFFDPKGVSPELPYLITLGPVLEAADGSPVRSLAVVILDNKKKLVTHITNSLVNADNAERLEFNYGELTCYVVPDAPTLRDVIHESQLVLDYL